jgi:hypothetical protein
MKPKKPGIKGLAKLVRLEEAFRKNFEAEDKAREEGLRLSRQVGRLGAQAVKKIHQADFDGALAMPRKRRSGVFRRYGTPGFFITGKRNSLKRS